MKKDKYNVAVIGATGSVGYETLNSIAERKFPIKNVYAVASSSSIGKEVSFGDSTLKVLTIEDLDFTNIDIAFFSAGSEVSKQYAKKAASLGCIVIDKSSLFRLDRDVPLIVPEVNLNDLKNHKNIISNPNCCSIPLALVLKPIDNAVTINRLVISTYQSVSGVGRDGMDELYSQTKAKYIFQDQNPSIFPKRIAFNIFPHIGDFNKDGDTSEEVKIALELEKIIGSHIQSSLTCVRVPVFVGHSMSVNIELENSIDALEVAEILSEADGIRVTSLDNEERYSTPIDVVGEDFAYVSRIRNDASRKNSINLWIACDNLRKGAALNAVQIAEELIKHYL